MAERRMFARAVTGGARFLRMPVTSRLLYYDFMIWGWPPMMTAVWKPLRLCG